MDPNSQVLLSIGIPTIAVLIGMLVNNRQIDQNSRLIEALRTHVGDKIDTRFNALQDMMNARFAAVDARFAAVDARFNAAHEALLRVEGVLDAPESSRRRA